MFYRLLHRAATLGSSFLSFPPVVAMDIEQEKLKKSCDTQLYMYWIKQWQFMLI